MVFSSYNSADKLLSLEKGAEVVGVFADDVRFYIVVSDDGCGMLVDDEMLPRLEFEAVGSFVEFVKGDGGKEERVFVFFRVFGVESVDVGEVDESCFEVARDFCCGAVTCV